MCQPVILCYDDSTSNKSIVLAEMFPTLSEAQIHLLLDLCGGVVPKFVSVKGILNAFISSRLTTRVKKTTVRLLLNALKVYIYRNKLQSEATSGGSG